MTTAGALGIAPRAFQPRVREARAWAPAPSRSAGLVLVVMELLASSRDQPTV